MGIAEDILGPGGWQAALEALAWQAELGVTEVVGDSPLDAFALPQEAPAMAPKATAPAPRPARVATEPAAPLPTGPDPVESARTLAQAAQDLEALRTAISGYDLCELKRGARNTVFADGRAGARVLILGEAPGREEDMEGRPFVGRAGQLLDRMFAAIGLSRSAPDLEHALYITNVLPWRPPQNRDPTPEEIAMMRPFVERHIELAAPEVVVVMGNTPLAALLNQRGITRARGQWSRALDLPVLPMCHPAYLLRNPHAKRDAWADLLALEDRLAGGGA
ncbi:uracil-DNA glycosylase [Neotabrizicola shimadae]|uniref:Type-4 uracil-DNA glycosylase n=1 Tax=Neotabrizicola shimadae TaxID=2807096 RepID=A0A8G0ZT32_9RHOB|nr:uracil-DNA glycosylase [Neotabrizicola shimadae]QYZ68198.1 uracil-DNA glycosylase [Neotabrizicola shimadae]